MQMPSIQTLSTSFSSSWSRSSSSIGTTFGVTGKLESLMVILGHDSGLLSPQKYDIVTKLFRSLASRGNRSSRPVMDDLFARSIRRTRLEDLSAGSGSSG